MNVWELLREAITYVPGPRPENSVTVEEFAGRTGYSRVHCRRLLAEDARLQAVPYMTESRKRAICYVPK